MSAFVLGTLNNCSVLQMGTKEQSEGLERALDHMCRKTRDLRRQLRKAVVDHVSDRLVKAKDCIIYETL